MNKQYKGRLDAQQDVTSEQANQFNQVGMGALQNIVYPGLSTYSSLIARLSNPGLFDRASNGLENELNSYSGRVSGMFNNAGYNADEKAGMTQSTMAPIAGAYAGAKDDLSRRGAVMNNPGTMAAGTGEMARMRARDTSTALGGLQKSFGDARIQGQQFALGAQQFVPQQQQQMMQGERSMTPAFQFAPQLGNEMYQGSASNTVGLMGQNASTTNEMGQVSTQPGFWGRLLKTAAETAQSAFGGKGH